MTFSLMNNRDIVGVVLLCWYSVCFDIGASIIKYNTPKLRLHCLYSCLYMLPFCLKLCSLHSHFFSDSLKFGLTQERSFRRRIELRPVNSKAEKSASPSTYATTFTITMAEEGAKLFPGHRFRSHPWPSAKVEDLADQDPIGIMMAQKTRVDNPVQDLMIVSRSDYIAVSIEVQCDIGTESLRSLPSKAQWPEWNTGKVSDPLRKAAPPPSQEINVISFKGDKEVEQLEGERDADFSAGELTGRSSIRLRKLLSCVKPNFNISLKKRLWREHNFKRNGKICRQE